MPDQSRSRSRRALPAWAYAIVFLVALAGSIRSADFSPVVWSDTSCEEGWVQTCLRNDACTTLGGGTSLNGVFGVSIFHMVGWVDFMVAAEWLGLGRDAIHMLIQVANALRIVLVMFVADRLGGAPAAALAPFFAFETAAAPGALYDSSPMAFLGTVLLVQCVAAVARRPSAGRLALAAAGGAVIAEVHIAGLMTLVSVVWVAMLYPPRRFARAAMAVIVFLVTMALISPKALVSNVFQVVSLLPAVVSTGRLSGSGVTAPELTLRVQCAAGSLIFLLPWVVLRLLRSRLGAPRRELQGALAVSLPVALGYAIGVLAGIFPAGSHGTDHYFEHVSAATAVVIAVPLAGIACAFWERIESYLPVWSPVVRAGLWIVPLFFSLGTAWGQRTPQRPQPHWADVNALGRLLHDDWRWNWTDVASELRSPDKALLLQDLSTAFPDWQQSPAGEAVRVPGPMVLIEIRSGRTPDPVPEGWTVVSRRMFYTLLAVPTGSALDWRQQTTCLVDRDGQEQCSAPGPTGRSPTLSSMDSARVSTIRSLVRHVPWEGAPGRAESVVMPTMGAACGGRIIAGPPGTEIGDDGRSARVMTPGDVVFEWHPGTPDCSIWDFARADDPFVIAGDAATVEQVIALLDQVSR